MSNYLRPPLHAVSLFVTLSKFLTGDAKGGEECGFVPHVGACHMSYVIRSSDALGSVWKCTTMTA